MNLWYVNLCLGWKRHQGGHLQKEWTAQAVAPDVAFDPVVDIIARMPIVSINRSIAAAIDIMRS